MKSKKISLVKRWNPNAGVREQLEDIPNHTPATEEDIKRWIQEMLEDRFGKAIKESESVTIKQWLTLEEAKALQEKYKESD